MCLAGGQNPVELFGLFRGIVQYLAACLDSERAFVFVLSCVGKRMDARAALQFSGRHAESVVHLLGRDKTGTKGAGGSDHESIDGGQSRDLIFSRTGMKEREPIV